jgi:hypothetical protein
MSNRDEIRAKYEPFKGLETADGILKIIDEHEKMERLLLTIQKIMEGEDYGE